MSTGIGNYPPGVTDSDPHFEGEPCQHEFGPDGRCEHCGEFDENCIDPDYEREELWRGMPSYAHDFDDLNDQE